MDPSAADRLETSGQAARQISSTPDAGSPVLPCPVKTHWIEIELVDPEDLPVANEPYWVRLPDRREVTGTLDDKGFARLDGIPAGTCLVRFPERDRRDFQPFTFSERTLPPLAQTPQGPKKKVWLEIELVDEEGVPVPRHDFLVLDDSGAEHRGKLNEKGFARLEGFLGPKCKVSFPNLDVSDFTGVVEHRDTPALRK